MWQILEKGNITSPLGFQATGIACGIKKAAKDLALLYSKTTAQAAGVFTTNQVKAAPLLVSQQNLEQGQIQAVVINSGNANACTGAKGLEDAWTMAEETAQVLNLSKEKVVVASTGVIGFPLPIGKVQEGIKLASKNLSEQGGQAAAEAIMTTDTFPKQIALTMDLDGKKVTLAGMAKGSGMIHPNMATMLGFITTDAAVVDGFLAELLKKAINKSFNMITVDGDTSTNDMVVIMANGLAGNKPLNKESAEVEKFSAALEYLTIYLAQQIVKDGEGASKLVEIQVKNALTESDAKKAAMSVATSSLVKTAIFGQDANWGRVIAAVGYSGAEIRAEKIDIFLTSAAGKEQMAQAGGGLAFDEEKAKKILAEKEIGIIVDLQLGEQDAQVWTCDLTYDYVKINAHYRS